ncbi:MULTISPECIES: MarR family transcriptional regulator [Haloferax]|uniref:MarR family transcriptional regulator n=2 Tax=Haloferax TaxID=2251 RepID=A0A6G1Z0I6_9EURY|nr:MULTISPECIES: MarR family transcriptional regulator [Haloferax]KAB1187388.1 MarR family transcriptional regulator [Haloferax sp. CBA1149]MRW80036.1 MarR family transcriptional regulator [Haloferax marinisediminis]
MNRQRADVVVGLIATTTLVFGVFFGWQADQQNRAVGEMMGPMMGGSMSSVHGTNPLWFVVGGVLASAAIGGLYLVFRSGLTSTGEAVQNTPTEATSSEETEDTTGSEPAESKTTVGGANRPRLLDVLPEDERRVLEPVFTSPGITQIELRDRSNFSKSKVSQTVSELEKRGLLYRERQGRTYRIYPSDDLEQNQTQ